MYSCTHKWMSYFLLLSDHQSGIVWCFFLFVLFAFFVGARRPTFYRHSNEKIRNFLPILRPPLPQFFPPPPRPLSPGSIVKRAFCLRHVRVLLKHKHMMCTISICLCIIALASSREKSKMSDIRVVTPWVDFRSVLSRGSNKCESQPPTGNRNPQAPKLSALSPGPPCTAVHNIFLSFSPCF